MAPRRAALSVPVRLLDGRRDLIDGVLPANPADAVGRPKVACEGRKRTVLHPLEFAALLAARASGPNDQALVCLLGMLGLRVSEACGADITDLRYESGYELLGLAASLVGPPLLLDVLPDDAGRCPTAGRGEVAGRPEPAVRRR